MTPLSASGRLVPPPRDLRAEAAPVGTTALAALRLTTGSRHEQIEALLQLEGDLPLHRYAAVVSGFELFLSHWEPLVSAALPERLREPFMACSRLALARRDALMLAGHIVQPPTPACLAVCAAHTALIDLRSTAGAFGSMYVLEGSALGGQVIARRVARSLGLGPDTGTAYFSGRGHGTAAAWREFTARLEAEVGASPRAREAACAAARQTFDALIDTFAVLLHEPVPA